MDEIITTAFNFYMSGIGVGVILGTISTVVYAGLYSLRS